MILVSIWIAAELLSHIDFSKVWAAMRTLTAAEIATMAVLLAVLRTLNATPLDLFIPKLTLRQAVLNDSSAYLVSTVSPPPSDMLLRYAMFNAWNIDLTAAFAGVALNSVLFYVVRFAAPIAGIIALVVATEIGSGVLITSTISAAIAIAILIVLTAVMRAEPVAAAVGRTGGRLAHRVRPDDVDPDQWSQAVVAFRANVGDQLRRTWPWASLAMLGMVTVDGTLLLTAMRSVGIDSSLIPALLVYGAFLVGYPLTFLPFGGLGVLDALLYALAMQRIGATYADAMIAALVLWRVTTVLAPLLIGLVTYGIWRRSNAARSDASHATTVGPRLDA